MDMSSISDKYGTFCVTLSSLAICPSRKHGTVSAECLPKPCSFLLRFLDINSYLHSVAKSWMTI